MTHPYASLAYARAFGADYEPIYLPEMDLHILKRPIAGTSYFDAMGPYPLSPVTSVDRARDDFAILVAHQIVSLVLVIDPVRAPTPLAMSKVFDKVTPFKDHFIREPCLDRPYSDHHRAKVRRAYRACETRIVRLADYLDDWSSLYEALSLKHQISGIQAFDRQYFDSLAKLEPFMVAAFMPISQPLAQKVIVRAQPMLFMITVLDILLTRASVWSILAAAQALAPPLKALPI